MWKPLQRLFDRPHDPAVNALILTGGGVRASYQAGVLQYIAEHFPEVHFPIVCGTSAGAINAAHLANSPGNLLERTRQMCHTWKGVEANHVYRSESAYAVVRALLRAANAQPGEAVQSTRGLIDPSPLRDFLRAELGLRPDGVLRNAQDRIEQGKLRALTVATTNYTTGMNSVWVQGAEVQGWQRPGREAVPTTLTLEHVMASAALPLLFPAVRLGTHWHGDGGIRQAAPISPAISLGATRVLAVTTRYYKTPIEQQQPTVEGYPPSAQVMGMLMNAVFLDVLEQDVLRLERLNRLLRKIPVHKREGLRPVNVLLLRPSRDIAAMASDYPLKLDGALRLLTRGMGVRETNSPDWLSMILFDPAYVENLLDLGYADAEREKNRIEAFLASDPAQ